MLKALLMKLTVVLGFGIVALGLGACTPAETNAPREISFEGNEFKFAPAKIEVPAGKAIRVTRRNTGSIEHDWSITEMPVANYKPPTASGGHEMNAMGNEAQIHMAVMMGKSATMEFTPTRPGTYQFFCAVQGHKEAGMVGTIVVN